MILAHKVILNGWGKVAMNIAKIVDLRRMDILRSEVGRIETIVGTDGRPSPIVKNLNIFHPQIVVKI